MSRIPLRTVGDSPDDVRGFMLRRGNLNVFRLLVNAPKAFHGWTVWVDELLDSTTFTARLRELVILRVAYLMESGYETLQHVDVATRVGISEHQIAALAPFRNLENVGFSDLELAVLTFVTELITTKHVSDEVFTSVHEVLGDEATVELLMLVHLYGGLALALNAVNLEVDTNTRLQIHIRQ